MFEYMGSKDEMKNPSFTLPEYLLLLWGVIVLAMIGLIFYKSYTNPKDFELEEKAQQCKTTQAYWGKTVRWQPNTHCTSVEKPKQDAKR